MIKEANSEPASSQISLIAHSKSLHPALFCLNLAAGVLKLGI